MEKFFLQKKQRGFTLVEMMVSVSIFVSVLAVSISSLLALVDANKRAQSLRVAIDNLDLVMEDMSRTIAQARTYHCDASVTPTTTARSCTSGADSIVVASNDSDIDYVTYEVATGAQGDYIRKIVYPNAGSPYSLDMTNPEVVTITTMNFRVLGALSTGAEQLDQPRVLVSVGGKAGEGERAATFDVQTTITQRVPK